MGRVFLVAAVLMFVWGFLFWAILGVGDSLLKPLPAELDVLAALRGSQTPSGMYVYPSPPADMNDQEAMAAFEAKHEEGPLLRMAYRAEGGPHMPPVKFAQGIGHYFGIALLSALLTALAAPALPTFGRRVGFVLLLSLIASVWTNVGDVVWWSHSLRYCLGNMAYGMGAGLLMGLAIAALVRAPTKENAIPA